MFEMSGRWASVCLACATWGCALLDQPIEGPKSTPALAHSRYEPIVSTCECSAQRARADLDTALGVLETSSNERLSPSAFDACVNALTGVPSIVPPLPIAPDTRPSLRDLRDRMEREKLGWGLWIDGDGRAELEVHSSQGVPVLDLERGLAFRILPTTRAFESAHLGSQLCHSTALFVALEARLLHDHSEASVVNRLASSARRLDEVAAASTGIVLELRRLARTSRANRPTQILPFRALEFDGEFASDGDDVERNARRVLAALGDEPKPGSDDPYVEDVALPLWLAPRPRLVELCNARLDRREEAVKSGLPALRTGDLGTIMLAARDLYPTGSTARQGLVTLCAILNGNDRSALRAARDMVPGYSSTGQLLSTLSLEPG